MGEQLFAAIPSIPNSTAMPVANMSINIVVAFPELLWKSPTQGPRSTISGVGLGRRISGRIRRWRSLAPLPADFRLLGERGPVLGPSVIGDHRVILTRFSQCDTLSHMKTVNVRDLHQRTGEIVDLAARGQVVTVLRRGVRVAELSSVREQAAKTLPNRDALLAKFPTLHGDSTRFLEEDRG